MTAFIETHAHRALAETLADLVPCPMAGKITVDQIKIVLGEVGDIWPECIRSLDNGNVVELLPVASLERQL